MWDKYNLRCRRIRVLIFNHTKYRNSRISLRPPEIGVKLEKFFMLAFYDVSHFYNLTKKEVVQELIKVSEDGLRYGALIVCVSSHGHLYEDEDKNFYETIQAYDDFYYKTELWRYFKDKENWKGKPKLFFIQACRGEDPSAGAVFTHDAVPANYESDPDESVFTELRYPDLFIMNASQQGTVSWRSKEGDSIFFDALIKVFTKKKFICDLLTMAVEISNRVARDHEACLRDQTDTYHCCQQMPCFETTLTKKFYFSATLPLHYLPDYIPEGKDFYKNIKNPLAIVLNYSYEGTRYPINTAKAKANKNALNFGLTTAGFTYKEFWDVNKAILPKLLKVQHESNNKDMILVIFNGYGERDELYLNGEKIKVYELWEPLLPDTKAGEESSGKPKIVLISALPPNPTIEGVTGKIDKLCKPPTGRNVEKCAYKLKEGQTNVPITADLFICYETGRTTFIEHLDFKGSPFLKMFSDELMNKDNTDFFNLTRNILRKFSNSYDEKVPLAFSTLRKLAPVGRLDLERKRFITSDIQQDKFLISDNLRSFRCERSEIRALADPGKHVRGGDSKEKGQKHLLKAVFKENLLSNKRFRGGRSPPAPPLYPPVDQRSANSANSVQIC